MKSNRLIPHQCLLLAGVFLTVSGLLTARASSSIVTFSVDMATNIAVTTFAPGTDIVKVRGTFDGWSAGGVVLVQEGTGTVYTNTVDNTSDPNGGSMHYTFLITHPGPPDAYETTACYNNRAVNLPATSGAGLVLPTPFFGDAGAPESGTVAFQVDMSQQINLGTFTNDVSTSFVEVRGNFNSWAGGATVLARDTTILRTNQYGVVTSNVYTGTITINTAPAASPFAANDFKYVIQPGTQYDSPNSTNSDSGGNRFFTFTNGAQVLPVVDFSDASFAPVAAATFNVDMSIVVFTDTNFNPTTVALWGDFNGWGSGVPMTNNPSASNTNIYSAVVSVGQGAAVNFQYRYIQANTGTTVYDHANGANGGNGNHYFLVPSVASVNVPAVVFNDASLDDYLLQDTPVSFTVDMNGAVGTDGHVFDPGSDLVYVNGQFINWYAWYGGITPGPAPAGYQLFETPPGSQIYSNTIVFPKGTLPAFNYKYGIGIGGNPGPNDDEATYGANHYRAVRTLAFNPYPLPKDKFGNMYGEPFFASSSTGGGNLTIGAASGGNVPVTWLGRPGAHLQVKADLTSGSWQDLFATDGTNWSSGYNSTNGFVSRTNWPVSAKAFFRLVKP